METVTINSRMAASKVFDLERLADFTAKLRSGEFVNYLQGKISYDVEEIRKPYFNYIEEAEFGVSFLSEFQLEGKRILEIGSGAGILTAWLLLNGIDIYGIEPSALGFGFHNDIYTAIWDYFQLPSGRVYDLMAEDLDPDVTGSFDLIFSINVMEHIPVKNLELVFERMKSVMKPGGILYHHCPNYFIPFEPHYGIPLVPFFPQLAGRLKKVHNEDLWKSVNFITLMQVRKIAERAGMRLRFKKRVMKDTFARLEHDKEFSSRHPVLTKVYKLAKALGADYVLGLIPPALCTPMTFTLSEKETAPQKKSPEAGK